MKDEVFIVAGLRTPIAHRGGALARVLPEELGARVIRVLLQRLGLQGEEVSGVLAGNAVGTGGNLARLMALRAGLPEEVPSCTVDMQCASAAAAISLAAAKIASGQGTASLRAAWRAPRCSRCGSTMRATRAMHSCRAAPIARHSSRPAS